MGGRGSGRRWQGGAPTTEDVSSVDIRWLHRQSNVMNPGKRIVKWSRCGVTTGSIALEKTASGLVFSYRLMPFGKDAVNVQCFVTLLWSDTQFGGRRPWFCCPRCGRRSAILFISATVACRKCLGIRHRSQNERASDRAIRRIDFLRDKLRWEPGFLNGSQWRPKGMHWSTYARLTGEYEILTDFVYAAVAVRFGFDLATELPETLD